MIRRVYSNWLPIEEYEPELPKQVTLELRGAELVVKHERSYNPFDEDEDGV